MKRIISIFLCVAMLMSMASMTVGAVGELEAEVTTKNVMSITTDKDSYAPGDTVVITASMESIWGDPALEGDIEGYEGDVMPGAYGMNILCANLIYDTSVFTAKAHKNLFTTSTIVNADAIDASVSGNNPIEAKANGAYYLMALSDIYNANYDGYGFFTGSGDLWQWNLTINADAAPGTYYLPVGPYVITDPDSVGKTPVIKFADEGLNDRMWAWLGNPDSLLIDREVEYKTGYDGPSRAMASFSYTKEDGTVVTVEDGTYRECSYVAITVEGDTPIDPPTPPEPVDPMSLELTVDGTDYLPGDTVTVNLSVKNNEGISSGDSSVTFNNTDLKLVDISSPVEGFGSANVNYEAANRLGSFDVLGTPVTADAYFSSSSDYATDGIILTATFEVLATAEGGNTSVSVTNLETGLDAAADVVIAGDHAHAFEDTVEAPTCTAQGSNYKVCGCGLSYLISKIPANNHTTTEESKKATRPATCLTEGVTVTYCDVCGNTAITETIDPLGHDIEVVKTELSCTTDETTKDRCKREGCGYESEVVVLTKALAHKNPDGTDAWGEPYIATKPTTNSYGFWGKDCALCGDVYRYEEIAMLPVVYGNCNMDLDNIINIQDATVLLMHLVGWENLYFSRENADVNIDGRVNSLDVTRILKYIAGWDVVLGQGSNMVG